MSPVEVIPGGGPVVLAMPHTGTWVPDGIGAGLNETGLNLADTDWHIDKLYDGLCDGATIVRATFHRYVIDANRDPAGHSLYPGLNTTALCPLTDFEGQPIHKAGCAPGEAETARRIGEFHAPYHDALRRQLERVRGDHGFAVLYDCHSIRSRLPFLFEGVLPDLNIGTNGGASCAPRLQDAVAKACSAGAGFTSVVNGRFKGGWTTRAYGRPALGIHAIQMEIAQAAYMAEAPPWTWDAARAAPLRTHLGAVLGALSAAAHLEQASKERTTP